jgi:hypothetical protein
LDEERLLVPAPLDNVLDLDAALRGLAEHDGLSMRRYRCGRNTV